MRAAGPRRVSRCGDHARRQASRRARRHGGGGRPRRDAVPDPDRLGAPASRSPATSTRAYGARLRRRARAAGVEAIAWRCAITCDGIEVAGPGSGRRRSARSHVRAEVHACVTGVLAYIAVQQRPCAARRRRGPRIPMSYVDAAMAPQRKTGQIKLTAPSAFEGMRQAGRLVAECLDMLDRRGQAGRADRPTSTGWCSTSPWTTRRCPRP